MAKFSGKVGFCKSQETTPGVWRGVVTEKQYYGDILRNYVRQFPTDRVNPNITLNNRISIIIDPYAMENAQYIVYAVLNGTKWSVYDIDIQYPRMILTLGDVYTQDVQEDDEDEDNPEPDDPEEEDEDE